MDADSGLVHSATGTLANEHGITKAADILHGDAGYVSIHKHEEHEARKVEWHIAVRPGKRKTMAEGSE